MRALRPAAVVAGHKDPARPDDPGIPDETGEYLRTALKVIATRPTPRAFFDEMTRRYPERVNPGTVWLNTRGERGRVSKGARNPVRSQCHETAGTEPGSVHDRDHQAPGTATA
ncbi:hypothetical protein [Nonomuraea sp. NPDC005501]|uniref:hypothetical protein n=1 Tax=Nonomuraea sp. NPDC005501 TaxID=3156884 RepID=UPI0033BC2EDF